MHFNCYKKTLDELFGSKFIPLYGFTQDPNNLDYMIVMKYANEGSLRDCLKSKYNSWFNTLTLLNKVVLGLQSIHESNLVHCDLHDGNILEEYISDLGLCKPIDYFKNKANNDIYGVLPYVAPEVLRGKPYTPASDIYSFSMIMWELTSKVPPFNDRA